MKKISKVCGIKMSKVFLLKLGFTLAHRLIDLNSIQAVCGLTGVCCFDTELSNLAIFLK